jgi:succinate dehydrogenase / fumarate reductase, cytochrome b subunit
MADSKLRFERPLSPHIQIYRRTLTMVMSIVHRITGAALYIGTLLLAVWLIAAASDEATFNAVQAVLGSFIGRLALLGYTWALLHHLIGGIHHLLLDVGYGFEIDAREKSAIVSLVASIGLTIVVWIVGYAVR